MPTIRTKRAALTLALVLVVAAVALFGSQSPSRAAAAHAVVDPAGNCWCTDYMYNYFGLHGSYGDAYTWGGYLTGQGWHQMSAPAVGYIIVLQRAAQLYVQNPATGYWFTYTADASHGHVGRIKKVTYINTVPRTYYVTFASAHNDNGTCANSNYTNCQWFKGSYADAGCGDVNDLIWQTDLSDSGYALYRSF